jgi:hypothetical protein
MGRHDGPDSLFSSCQGCSHWSRHPRPPLRHATDTLDRYSHMTPRLMSNAAELMDRLLDQEA